MDKVNTFIELADKAQAIMNSGADWETVYDLIFSDDISVAIRETGIDFRYCDPDTSYEADVKAYVSAIQRKATQLRKIAQVFAEGSKACRET